MTPQSAPNATASVDISADPQTVYALVTDLSTLAALAEEATEQVHAHRELAVVRSIAPATVIAWSRGNGFPGRVGRLHFTFGNPGWYSPADNIARLADHLAANAS